MRHPVQLYSVSGPWSVVFRLPPRPSSCSFSIWPVFLAAMRHQAAAVLPLLCCFGLPPLPPPPSLVIAGAGCCCMRAVPCMPQGCLLVLLLPAGVCPSSWSAAPPALWPLLLCAARCGAGGGVPMLWLRTGCL